MSEKEYVAIYIKILEGKDKTISIDGPFIGPSSYDRDEVEEELRTLVNASSVPVIPKIYCCNKGLYQDAMNEAKTYFDAMTERLHHTHEMMQEDIDMHKRRTQRKKKKKDG